MISDIHSIKSERLWWRKLTNVRVLAMIVSSLIIFSACAPMTSVRNGLEYQSKLRDQVTGDISNDNNFTNSESETNEQDAKIDKIAEFEKMLLSAKKEKSEGKQKIDEMKASPTKIIKAEETENLAVAGMQSRDDLQDESISSNNRKLLTFKEQFNSLETKHDQLATKVGQIEEELKFLRGQVIALNSRKETFINKENVAQEKTKSKTNIIESDEKIAEEKEEPKPEKSKESSTSNSNQELELAEQFYNKGKYKDAIASYLKAMNDIKVNRVKSEALYKVAMSHYHLKNYEKSIEYFDQVCSLAENMYKDDAQIQIAEANMRLGKIDEAKKAYKNVLAVYPRSKHIPKARKMLQQL